MEWLYICVLVVLLIVGFGYVLLRRRAMRNQLETAYRRVEQYYLHYCVPDMVSYDKQPATPQEFAQLLADFELLMKCDYKTSTPCMEHFRWQAPEILTKKHREAKYI